MVKISKNGRVFEASSLNALVKDLGATSGMNRTVALKYLERAGFDMSTLVEDKKTSGAKRVVMSLIERVIEASIVIDNELIEQKNKELWDLTKTIKTLDDISGMQALQKEIENLQKPEPNLETVVAWVTKEFKEHMERLEQAEQETEQSEEENE